MAEVPNPGSEAARSQGCICPVMDNWRGSDELGRIRGFAVVSGCPLHWTRGCEEHDVREPNPHLTAEEAGALCLAAAADDDPTRAGALDRAVDKLLGLRAALGSIDRGEGHHA